MPGSILPGRTTLGDDWPFVPQTPSPPFAVCWRKGEGGAEELSLGEVERRSGHARQCPAGQERTGGRLAVRPPNPLTGFCSLLGVR